MLAEFRRLRTLDNHIYLRAGSLNVVNGLVGLNFSCAGSHYLNYTRIPGPGWGIIRLKDYKPPQFRLE